MSELEIGLTDGSAALEFSDDHVPAAAVNGSANGANGLAMTVGSGTTGPVTPAPQRRPQSPLATDFEGAAVTKFEIKIAGKISVDGDDNISVTLDDIVRMVGTYRVTKVIHYADAKTGETVRQHTLSPVEALQVTPFDSSNPNDDGIIRARP
jgi:hypothetical protein